MAKKSKPARHHYSVLLFPIHHVEGFAYLNRREQQQEWPSNNPLTAAKSQD
jgi:hypothetical protein